MLWSYDPQMVSRPEQAEQVTDPAAILFLGHRGEWWDLCLVVSLAVAAVGALAVLIFTFGSVEVHKREALVAEQELRHFKLETNADIAKSNARAEEAKANAAYADRTAALARERAAQATQHAARLAAVIVANNNVSSGRSISISQARILAKYLAGKISSVGIVWREGDPESQAYAAVLTGVLHNFAGIGVRPVNTGHWEDSAVSNGFGRLVMHSPISSDPRELVNDPLFIALNKAGLYGNTAFEPILDSHGKDGYYILIPRHPYIQPGELQVPR